MSTESTKEKFNKSETLEINRSQINFAPYNPKKHSKDAIAAQKRNFKKVGFLGGIVWNETTGNLVSGHKRTMAMDDINKYDGTPATDYLIKVEKITIDQTTEKEQNIYMDSASTNTAQDADMLRAIIPDIDWENAGLTEEDLKIIGVEFAYEDTTNLLDEITEMNEPTIEERAFQKEANKQKIIEAKKEIRESLDKKMDDGDPFIVLSFDNYAAKVVFMKRFDFDSDQKYVKGEILSEMIERID